LYLKKTLAEDVQNLGAEKDILD